jgi:hypothetical protein
MANYCKTFKSAKEGKVSFLVTQKLLTSAYEKARTAKKKGMIVISIPAEDGSKYIINCEITKEKM